MFEWRGIVYFFYSMFWGLISPLTMTKIGAGLIPLSRFFCGGKLNDFASYFVFLGKFLGIDPPGIRLWEVGD